LNYSLIPYLSDENLDECINFSVTSEVAFAQEDVQLNEFNENELKNLLENAEPEDYIIKYHPFENKLELLDKLRAR
jgi:hypothetical protein